MGASLLLDVPGVPFQMIRLPIASSDGACFEALNLWGWIDVARSDAGHVVILANDHWTAPFTTTLLRRKVAAQFAVLFHINVHHADSEKSALWVWGP